MHAPPVLARLVAHDPHLDDVDWVARRRAAEARDAARDEVRPDALVEVLREVALETAPRGRGGQRGWVECREGRERRRTGA